MLKLIIYITVKKKNIQKNHWINYVGNVRIKSIIDHTY